MKWAVHSARKRECGLSEMISGMIGMGFAGPTKQADKLLNIATLVLPHRGQNSGTRPDVITNCAWKITMIFEWRLASSEWDRCMTMQHMH